MKAKHYIAIVLPYLIAGAIAAATLASKSVDPKVAIVGVAILAIFAHRNQMADSPKQSAAPTVAQVDPKVLDFGGPES